MHMSEMTPEERSREALTLMRSFVDRTKVGESRRLGGRRYLWTDAFAVCTLEALAVEEGCDNDTAEDLGNLALALVYDVHDSLGRYRANDENENSGSGSPSSRAGTWISGLSEAEGREHPTLGGLRIGKSLPERAAKQRYDARLEWERDGQYFHYLTKWMHALDQTARTTGTIDFVVWASELAITAHRGFVYGLPGQQHMYWKMSTDLTRPLVPTMGQHDPLDGYITCRQLELSLSSLASSSPSPSPSLKDGVRIARQSYELMLERDEDTLATSDPLGLGGILVDAYRLLQINQARGSVTGDGSNNNNSNDNNNNGNADVALARSLLLAGLIGLRQYTSEPDLRLPPELRLGFRELGLSIGLAAIEKISDDAALVRTLGSASRAVLEELTEHIPLRTEIESFWFERRHRRAHSWTEHLDINEVMLATSLVPDGFLCLRPQKAAEATATAIDEPQQTHPKRVLSLQMPTMSDHGGEERR